MKVLREIKIALAITVVTIWFVFLYLLGLELAARGAIFGFMVALATSILFLVVYGFMCFLRYVSGWYSSKRRGEDKRLVAKPNWKREFKNVFWVSSIWSPLLTFAFLFLNDKGSVLPEFYMLFGAIFSSICSFGFVWLTYWSIIYIQKYLDILIKSC